MKVRPLLYLTAFVAAILGATAAYLALSVPNDLRADALLKDARKDLTDGNNDKARASLSKVVLQYPRTDAAAAATVALASLSKKERDDLSREIAQLRAQLRAQTQQQSQLISDLQRGVSEVKNAPPKVVTVTVPAPKPPAKKKVPPKKKMTTKKRRR